MPMHADEVADEVRDAIAARSAANAAAVIEWWHRAAAPGTPRDADRRIREAAETPRPNA